MSEDYETLLTVLDNLMDGLIIIDKEMNVLLFNQSAADLFGVGSIHDVSGVNVFDFVHPEDRERAERIALKDMFEEDLQEINEFRAITADGREIWLSAAGKKIVYNGRTAGLISLRDITKTKIIEESLRESEEKFRLFFETTKDAVAIISQGRFIEFNQATLELLGCTEDELRSRTTGEFYLNPQDREQFLTLLEEKGFVKDYRVDFRRCDGKIVRALMTASALRDSEGNITRIHGITRDITEKLKTEDALRKSESYYKSLFENTLIPVLILEEDGTISMVNKEAERISGYSRDDLEGKLCTDFILEEDRMSVVPEGKISPENILERLEFRIIDGCGNIRNIFGTYGRIPGTEKIVASGIDITEQKRAQKRLKELLDEKETLLREIHHRVKNNLQVVSSLISLQAHGITDEKTIENLREVQNRVNSMARIHKQLYESENLAKINFKNYTEGMVPEILYSYGVMGGDIKTDIKMENIELSIETAVSLALILTEIVSNCVKHAFPEGKGEIKIELLPGEEFYTLSVSDNGVGVPEINLENPETLGLQLINALSRQIGGRIEIKAGHGTTFKIEFPADLKLK